MTGFAAYQHTLATSAILAGVGLHTGERVRMAVRPAAPDTGIVFVRTDVRDRDNRVVVSPEAVVRTQLGTVIENAAGVTVSTIEHLMAALAALDVDNAVVEVDGPEVPIMDGSALPFVKLLDRADNLWSMVHMLPRMADWARRYHRKSQEEVAPLAAVATNAQAAQRFTAALEALGAALEETR